jgi:indolepyruvate ferredoxin oxidoreductase, beta subunit
MDTLNILVTGVGGQGALLVSDVLSLVGVRLGFDVKKSEVHGMSQRGGSVTSHVRWGVKVYSPVIAAGEADLLIALEKLECLRSLEMLKPGGIAVVGDLKIEPIAVSSGGEHYPTDQEIRRALAQVTENVIFVPSAAIAESLGSSRVHNISLVGAVASLLGLPDEPFLQVISERVPPRHVEVNRLAYLEGRAAAESLLQKP